MDTLEFVSQQQSRPSSLEFGNSPSDIIAEQQSIADSIQFGHFDTAETLQGNNPTRSTLQTDLRDFMTEISQIGKKGMDTTECYSDENLKMAYLNL